MFTVLSLGTVRCYSLGDPVGISPLPSGDGDQVGDDPDPSGVDVGVGVLFLRGLTAWVLLSAGGVVVSITIRVGVAVGCAVTVTVGSGVAEVDRAGFCVCVWTGGRLDVCLTAN